MKKFFALLLICLLFPTFESATEFDAHEWGVFEYYQGVGVDIFAGKEDLPDFVFHSSSLKPDVCGKKCKCTGKCPDDCQHTMWFKGKKIQQHCDHICSGKACNHPGPGPSPMIRKPVINFYAKDDFKLDINVSINGGKLTAWSPKHSSEKERGNTVTWNNLDITSKKPGKALREAKGSSWWETARDTESCYVKTKEGEVEKFLFYEGEREKLTPQIELKQKKGKISLANTSKNKYSGVFVVNNTTIHFIDELNESKEVNTDEALNLNGSITKLENMLTTQGLTKKEAQGIAKIWEKEFFEKEGLRVIYMMPREEIDKILNVEFSPKPKEFKRAILVVVHDTESLVKELIKKLGSEDVTERDRATDALIKLGKAARSLIANALNNTKDPEVKSRLQKILDEIDSKKGSNLNEKNKFYIKDGTCNGLCDRVHYPHPTSEKHTLGANCIRCDEKIDVCYLLCKACCKELTVCYGCNKIAQDGFKDPNLCKCGKERQKANDVKYQILLSKEDLTLNGKPDEIRYIARTLAEWEDMLRALGVDTLTAPDFNKEMVLAIAIGNGSSIDLRTIFETDKWIKVIYTLTPTVNKKNNYTLVVLKCAMSNKKVYCGAGLDKEFEFLLSFK